eukprot:superscaffoldBa00003806_g17729
MAGDIQLNPGLKDQDHLECDLGVTFMDLQGAWEPYTGELLVRRTCLCLCWRWPAAADGGPSAVLTVSHGNATHWCLAGHLPQSSDSGRVLPLLSFPDVPLLKFPPHPSFFPPDALPRVRGKLGGVDLPPPPSSRKSSLRRRRRQIPLEQHNNDNSKTAAALTQDHLEIITSNCRRRLKEQKKTQTSHLAQLEQLNTNTQRLWLPLKNAEDQMEIISCSKQHPS